MKNRKIIEPDYVYKPLAMKVGEPMAIKDRRGSFVVKGKTIDER